MAVSFTVSLIGAVVSIVIFVALLKTQLEATKIAGITGALLAALGETPILFAYFKTARGHRSSHMLIRDHSSDTSFEWLQEYVRGKTWFFPAFFAVELSKSLKKAGRWNSTVRLWKRRGPHSGELIDVNVDPVILNEADDRFVELRAAVGGPLISEDRDDGGDWARVGRSFRRHMRLSGGYGGVFMVLLFSVREGLECWKRGSLSFSFIALVIAFAVPFVFLLVESPGSQWLLVNGGLVRRKTRLRGKSPSLHIFDRRSSVMTLCEIWRDMWQLRVDDEKVSATGTLTSAEADMLLRAWLSPIPPPSVDKLIDLT